MVKATQATPKKRDWKPTFLAKLRDCGNVRLAAEATKIGRQWVYKQRGEDQEFAAAWDEALDEACDLLEAEARRRGLDGTDKPVFHAGEVCGHIREYSDTLLIFLLKGYRPARFRERFDLKHEGQVKLEHGCSLSEKAATDPETAKLACRLLERLTAGTLGTGMAGPAGERR